MQQKPTPPPPNQPTLPLQIPQRAGAARETGLLTEQTVADHCSPEETWQMLDTQGRDRLCETWVRVLKEVVSDAQDC